MPNTKASQAAFVANRILTSHRHTGPGIDRAILSINFGVANLPADGKIREPLQAVAARLEARSGNFSNSPAAVKTRAIHARGC